MVQDADNNFPDEDDSGNGGSSAGTDAGSGAGSSAFLATLLHGTAERSSERPHYSLQPDAMAAERLGARQADTVRTVQFHGKEHNWLNIRE